MNKKSRLTYLLKRWAQDTISEEEHIELLTCLNEDRSNSGFYAAMDEVWKDGESAPLNTEKQKKALYNKIVSDPRFQETKIFDLSKRKDKNLKWWFQLIAASVLILVSIGIYQYSEKKELSKHQSTNLGYVDIPPGGERAMLTLADGSEISLDEIEEGEIVNQLGISVSKTADGQILYKIEAQESGSNSLLFNKISTPTGGQYQLVLSDGTKVWLNAESSLSYPTSFDLKERKVELIGEAYFEVAKSNTPFFVMTKSQKINVLGTHFNVNSYEDEGLTRTTLLEGSVHVSFIKSVSSDIKTKGYTLKPGQQAILKNDDFKIVKADLETTMDWRNNDFVFKEESIQSIMRKVARWYDIEVEYIGENENLRFGGLVSRKKNISTILNVLESTGLVKFKVNGRRVIVMI